MKKRRTESKLLVLGIIALLLVLSVTACGKKGKGPGAIITVTPAVTEPAKATSVPDLTQQPDVTQTPDLTQQPDVTQAPVITDNPEVSPTAATVTLPPELLTPAPTEAVTPTMPVPTIAADPYNINWWLQEYGSDTVLLTADKIYELNCKNLKIGATALYDMLQPEALTYGQIAEKITGYSFPGKKYLDGKSIDESSKNAILENRNLEALTGKKNEKATLKFAVVTANTSLRSFPTDSRISDDTGRHDYFQETGLNIGEPLIILGESKDGRWSFVQAYDYYGWVKNSDFGICSEKLYKDYTEHRYSKNATAVVAGKNANVRIMTVQVPGSDKASKTVYEGFIRMGTTLFTSDILTGSVFEFPLRNADGSLYFEGVRCENAAEKDDPVFINREINMSVKSILTYSGRLLGTPYSWGDEKENGMDCSSTLQAVYAMFGLRIPRNTSSQIAMDVDVKDISALDSAGKTKYISERSAGTILYMPGHVMMLLGEYNGKLYILHNTTTAARDDGKSDEYYSCVITTIDIGAKGKTLLDRITKVINLW